jgi:hypothetical protein
MAAGYVDSTDKFDEVRRAWIAGHQGWSTIQRRRAERLGRRVRARQREVATAVPDPHDDTTIPALVLRTAQSPPAQLELIVVTIVAIVVPLGWLGGLVLKHAVVRLIPSPLRAFPIAGLLWSGVVLGITILTCYNPGPSLARMVGAPWLCAQLAAVPAIAGMYGVLDGWLAIPGSERWWPLTPSRSPLTKADAVDILGGYDSTGPGLVDAQRLNVVGERSA